MATSVEYVEFVCGQLKGIGEIRYKKMFGEYMVYINDKPVVLVCNNTAYIKMLPEISQLMASAETDYPYKGAKMHYILDIDSPEPAKQVVSLAESLTPVPKPRKKRKKD